MAVCKSPLTGGWGDANSGGYFGAELKAAGWDAIFVTGAASSPKYINIFDDRIEIKDAAHLWGQDTADTEKQFEKMPGIKRFVSPPSGRLLKSFR